MNTVSVILINYNAGQITCNCIESIYKQVKSCDYEIIVVDNASADNSVERIKSSHPAVKLIQSDENLGFGRANNLGVTNAKGEFVFLLNNDTILKNDPFPYFFKHFENEPSTGIVGCLLKTKNGEYG